MRPQTNLRTNIWKPPPTYWRIRALQAATSAPDRWQSFHHDLAYFRTLENARRWTTPSRPWLQRHPVWNIAARCSLTWRLPARTQIYSLNSLDSSI